MEGRGWTLTALANRAGASVGAISDLKQGRTKQPRGTVALELHHLYSTGAQPPTNEEENKDG